MAQTKTLIFFISTLLLLSFAAARGPSSGRRYAFTLHAKVVATICAPAADKPACCKALKKVESDDPKELLKALVSVAQNAFKQSHNFTDELMKKSNSAESLKYCIQRFEYAVDDLQKFIDTIGDDIQNIGTNYYDLKQLLNGVWVSQSDCLDNISDAELSSKLENVMADGKKYIGNALDVFAKVPETLGAFGVKFD